MLRLDPNATYTLEQLAMMTDRHLRILSILVLQNLKETMMTLFADLQAKINAENTLIDQMNVVITAHGQALADARTQIATLQAQVAAGQQPTSDQLDAIIASIDSHTQSLTTAVNSLTASDPTQPAAASTTPAVTDTPTPTSPAASTPPADSSTSTSSPTSAPADSTPPATPTP